jgi:hypothetical protein
MTNLEKLLNDNNYTNDEWETHQKIEFYHHLCDFEKVLDDMLSDERITQKQYEYAKENADIIVSKFEKWLDYEWKDTMIDAINYIIKGE